MNAFIAPRSALEKKPPHGDPCTRCGLCCMAKLCRLAEALFNGGRPAAGPCPALVMDEGGYYACGVVAASAGDLREAALVLTGAGLGCDARFNGEPRNQEFADRIDREHPVTSEKFVAARRLWGIT